MAKVAALLLAVVALCGLCVPSASAYGYLSDPPARNALWTLGYKDVPADYCPSCLTAGGPETVSDHYQLKWPAGKHGLCGDPANKPQEHLAGGLHANGVVAKYYRVGQDINIKIVIQNQLDGAFEFSLCPLANPAVSNEATQACFNKHKLQRADSNGRWWFLPSTASGSGPYTYTMKYTLPAGVKCERCVLQWHYLSGNACYNPSWPVKERNPSVPECGSTARAYPEEAWNCADIAIGFPAKPPTPAPGHGCYWQPKPAQTCEHNPKTCGWNPIYNTKASCCKAIGGCTTPSLSPPPPVSKGCYRATAWYPVRECGYDAKACNWQVDVWATKAECCKPGNGHPEGCGSAV